MRGRGKGRLSSFQPAHITGNTSNETRVGASANKPWKDEDNDHDADGIIKSMLLVGVCFLATPIFQLVSYVKKY